MHYAITKEIISIQKVPCKRSRYSNRTVGNSNKRGTKNNTETTVYNKFIKQIRAVRHSLNTQGRWKLQFTGQA